MSWWTVAFFLAVLVAAAIQWLRDALRASAVKKMAGELGFRYIGKGRLPEALSLYGTPFNGVEQISNLIDGERGGIRVLAFDCRIGSGKGSRQRTVIAARSPADPFAAKKFNPDLTVVQSAAWQILYYPGNLTPPGKTELTPVGEWKAILESIG